MQGINQGIIAGIIAAIIECFIFINSAHIQYAAPYLSFIPNFVDLNLFFANNV
jgi:fucose permease